MQLDEISQDQTHQLAPPIPLRQGIYRGLHAHFKYYGLWSVSNNVSATEM